MLASSAIRKGDAMLGHPCENSNRPSFGNTWDITQISFRSTEKSQTAYKPRCQLYQRNSCKMSFWGKPSWFLCDPPDISSARRRGKIFLLLFLFSCPLPVVLLTGVRLKKRSWNITQLLKWNLSLQLFFSHPIFPTLLQQPKNPSRSHLLEKPLEDDPRSQRDFIRGDSKRMVPLLSFLLHQPCFLLLCLFPFPYSRTAPITHQTHTS